MRLPPNFSSVIFSKLFSETSSVAAIDLVSFVKLKHNKLLNECV